MASTTTLKLSPDLRERIDRLAKASGRTPHGLMVQALEREVAREMAAGSDHPMGVHGSYEDLADAILYLLSPAASYVTGTVLEVAGGWRQPGT